MKHLLPILAALLLLTACHKDKNDKEEKVATQSVLVYIAGDNNLSSFTSSDIRQMMEGSKELTESPPVWSHSLGTCRRMDSMGP